MTMLPDEGRELLEQAEELEAAGAQERIGYYDRLLSPAGGRPLLDVGCGNGYGVAEWRERGFEAYGVDNSLYRLGRWLTRHGAGPPLVVADAGALPFADGSFDVVISSGMIEHVGVEERSRPYTVRARPDRDRARLRVTGEIHRVAAPAGVAVVDCPNGSFPVDFWHGDRIGAFRLHRVPDVLLPTYGDFRGWGRETGFSPRLRPLGGRLSFRQIGRRWWGRLLRPLAALYLAVLDLAVRIGLGWLVAPLYPYLVVELGRVRNEGMERGNGKRKTGNGRRETGNAGLPAAGSV